MGVKVPTFCELERIRVFEFEDLDSGSWGKGSMVERCLDCVQLAIHRVGKELEIKTAEMAQRIVHERIRIFVKEMVVNSLSLNRLMSVQRWRSVEESHDEVQCGDDPLQGARGRVSNTSQPTSCLLASKFKRRPRQY